jgi:plastocyanin
MAINTVIEIRRVNNVTTFTPDPANIKAGDSVNWLNSDDRGDQAGAHQLAPVGGSPTAWMQFPVLPGPGGETSLVYFPNAGPIAYQCVVAGHQNERGTINVT